MNENPYSQIVSLLRQEMPGQFLRIGTVSGTSPLSVSVGGFRPAERSFTAIPCFYPRKCRLTLPFPARNQREASDLPSR